MCISKYIHIKCNRQTSAVIVVRVLVKRNNVSYHQEEEHAQEEDERRKSRVTCQARRQSDSYIAFPSCGNLRMSMCGENQIFPNANSNCQCMHMHADLRKTTHKVVFLFQTEIFLRILRASLFCCIADVWLWFFLVFYFIVSPSVFVQMWQCLTVFRCRRLMIFVYILWMVGSHLVASISRITFQFENVLTVLYYMPL